MMAASEGRFAASQARLFQWALPALLVLTALAYAPLWHAGFCWDDEALVIDNQLTGRPGVLDALLTRDLWSTTRLAMLPGGVHSGYYRPLMLLSLDLDRRLFGLSPGPAHLHSLAWHLLAVLALHQLLKRLVSPSAALLGAALFALHPVQSEVLALVAARNDAMAAAFSFLALGLVPSPQERRPGRLLAAGLLTLLGLLSKESAALIPAFLVALDLGRGGHTALRQGWPRYLALGLAVVTWLGLRAALGIRGGLGASTEPATLLAQAGQVLGVYARLLLWPWPLSPARHLGWLPPVPSLLPALLGLLALAVARGRDRGLVLAGLAWAALGWLPSLAATLDKGLLGERYLYLPLAGLGLAAGAALGTVPRWLVPALAAPAVLVLQLRLPDWSSSEQIWRRAHELAPTPYTASGLGWYLHRDGDLQGAIPLFVQALAGEPPDLDPCELLLPALLQDRDPARAAELGGWAIDERGCPVQGQISQQWALALASTGRWEEAVAALKRRPGGAVGPGLIVVGAAQARAGNLAGLVTLTRAQPDPDRFLGQVAELLRLGGLPQAAVQVQALRAAPAPP